jgi:hypothetical protein
MTKGTIVGATSFGFPIFTHNTLSTYHSFPVSDLFSIADICFFSGQVGAESFTVGTSALSDPRRLYSTD